MGKPLSWKWKLTLFSVFCALAFVAWIFTEAAHDWVIGQINFGYSSTPESERRDSAWAGRFLFWAAFKGNVCGDYKPACSMYKEFCGLPKEYDKRAYDYVASPAFQKNNTKNSFKGKVSQDGKVGWGPLHPDAPDAYYNYICLLEPNEVSATTGREAKVYYLLFYDWHIKHSEDHKPHPKFMKYWDKVRQKTLDSHVGFTDIPGFSFEAKKAVKWVEPD